MMFGRKTQEQTETEQTQPEVMVTSAASPIVIDMDKLMEALKTINRYKERLGACMEFYVEGGRLKVKIAVPEDIK